MDAIFVVGIVSFILLLLGGLLCIFLPALVIRANEKMVPARMKKGKIATPIQAQFLFRLQGLGLIFLAFVVLRKLIQQCPPKP